MPQTWGDRWEAGEEAGTYTRTGQSGVVSDAEELDATDSAVALAAELGVDLADVEGSGKDGRITKADVEALVPTED